MSKLRGECGTLCLGGGLAGLAAALHRPTGDAICLEAESTVGGECRSSFVDGFTFDRTGHWLHLRDPQVKSWLFGLMGEDSFVQVARRSRIWSHGCLTEYPFQSNLYGLPSDVIAECLESAIRTLRPLPNEKPETAQPETSFADWIVAHFGEGIARHFMLPYNARLWGVPATEITADWCQRFVPRPDLFDIVRGAVGCHQQVGYNARFFYPKQGGIGAVAQALANALPGQVFCNTPVTRLDLQRRVATTPAGDIHFEHLISSLPLPVLLNLSTNVPAEVRAAAGKLRATPVSWLDIGVEGELKLPDHWLYVPEAEWPMYRVGSYSNVLSTMAPANCGSLYVELCDRDADFDLTEGSAFMTRVREGLSAMGFIDRDQPFKVCQLTRARYAYVIYDFNYQAARRISLDWLSERGVESVGRYGDWNYSSMEDALIAGREAALRCGV